MNRFLRFIQVAGIVIAVLGLVDIIAAIVMALLPDAAPEGDGVIVEPEGWSTEWTVGMIGFAMVVVGFFIAMVPGVFLRMKRTRNAQLPRD